MSSTYPVELIGRGEQLKFFENKLEFPGIRHKAAENRPKLRGT